MAAPTNTALVKKALANSEPSTHGPSRPIAALQFFGRYWGTADIGLRWRREGSVAIDPTATSARHSTQQLPCGI